MKPEEFKKYIEKYGNDEKALIRENPSLENLYAFSNLREGCLEWYPFEEDARVLLLDSDQGALCRVFLSKKCRLSVLEKDPEEAEKIRLRYKDADIEISDRVSGKYDYIISVGDISALDMGSFLEKKGKLIIACANRYGIKYLSGTVPGKKCFSRQDIERHPEYAGGSNIWYYPVRDYLIPSAIYSDERLPLPGELSHVIPAYDDSEYSTVDRGEKYDEICRDGRFGQFANSFMVIHSREEDDGPRAVFVKYNRLRKDEFRIRTVILQRPDGSRYVEKTALCPEGKDHIASLEKKCRLLESEGREIEYVRPVISEDGMTASYEYLEGKTLEERIAENISEGADPCSELKTAINRIIGTEPVHNIDSILGNYFVGGRALGGRYKLTGIDCEWVSVEEQDPAYITWRMLSDFYASHSGLLGNISRDAFLGKFDLTRDDDIEFRRMEHDFQSGITGDVQAIYFDSFRVKVRTAKEITEAARRLTLSIDREEGLKAQILNKDAQIRKMTEAKRLTDNHVSNLEHTIADLRHEVEEQKKAIAYFSGHEALWSRLKRKLGNRFREKYPQGSAERKKFEYRKMAVLHPFRYMAMKNSPEGRNLIEGDFKIGDSYRQHGKLHFNRVREPLVSIIIPCFNQVEYTYNCLVSILENTGDISYEIILADDHSTDATSEIDKYVTGTIIAKPEKNCGFLLNCNNAAKQAHGKYILFLNNDTTVTENWLKPLVELLDRDPAVGMTGSKLVFPDGRLQEAGGIIWSDGSGWNYGRGDDPDHHEYNYVREVDYISGAAIMIRKELWKSIGGFDERFAPAYCEDSDLAFAVRKAGYKVVYQPLSKVIHYEGISNGTDVHGEGLKKYQLENSEKLKEKWAAEFAEQFENDGNPDPFRARERSRGKKIILFVDHYVPTYDRDAGSRTTFMYLKMLLKKGYEIKFLGMNYHHDEPYSTALQQMGIEILYGEYMQTGIWEWIDRHAGDIHLVYLNRPHVASAYIDYIKRHTDLKCIYYGHDLHFLREEREFALTGDIKTHESSEYWRSVEIGLMRKTDVNYFPSQPEVEAVRKIDDEINVKAITAFVYEGTHEIPPEKRDFAEREGILFVGGFSHPPNKDGLLWFVKNIWPEVRANTNAVFYVVGSNADEEIMALDDIEKGICIKGFVSDEELGELYDSCRIVAVPLRYGAGVKGKVMEALYYGCPVITTETGAEGIRNAESVMKIMKDEKQWKEYLSEMYRTPSMLSKMSGRAIEYIRENNSAEAAWKIIEGDFS